MNIYITGVGGTLGQAFVSLLHKKHTVSGIDRNETAISQLLARFPKVQAKVGDIGSASLGGQELLIHLAAMKHIDLCETQPSEAILNNVIKTYWLLRKAKLLNVDILFMSTDKAVEPCSVYGYSKALIENMVRELGGAYARSGNIVSSSGSVGYRWSEAIAAGEPIKITHKDMRRYFITPENLARRVWQQYAQGAKEIIPEMDREIGLMELAEEELSKHDYTLEDYPYGVEFIGLRPGEKLKEKLSW